MLLVIVLVVFCLGAMGINVNATIKGFIEQDYISFGVGIGTIIIVATSIVKITWREFWY